MDILVCISKQRRRKIVETVLTRNLFSVINKSNFNGRLSDNTYIYVVIVTLRFITLKNTAKAEMQSSLTIDSKLPIFLNMFKRDAWRRLHRVVHGSDGPAGRVGSGRVTILPDFGGSGRVGSGQTFCRQSRVGSGRVNVSPGRVGSGPRKVTRGQL